VVVGMVEILVLVLQQILVVAVVVLVLLVSQEVMEVLDFLFFVILLVLDHQKYRVSLLVMGLDIGFLHPQALLRSVVP
jgi:hypothetical protein